MPLVYEELRKLAAAKMAQEKPGQTLQATALVHEAYIRLVDRDTAKNWDSRGHFFAAAAEAMRRILVDNAVRKRCLKHGGQRRRWNWTRSAFGTVPRRRTCWLLMRRSPDWRPPTGSPPRSSSSNISRE